MAKRHSMSLETGITMFTRVYAYDAGEEKGIPAITIVERFYTPLLGEVDRLLDTCHFALMVVRQNKVEESIVCKDYDDLVYQLMAGVHAGRELAYGEYWSSELEEPDDEKGED